jgi:hypothetical protein
MPYTLPLEDQHRPLTRVLVSQQWANQSWETLSMAPRWDVGVRTNGYEIVEWERRSLPDIGQATFVFHYGAIDGRMFGVDQAGSARDLTGWYVRIQVADGPTATQQNQGGFVANWRTSWLGRVEQHDDQLMPGATYPIGLRTYHCLEIISVASRWPMIRHAWLGVNAPTTASPARGHPGYNYSAADGTKRGNKGTKTFNFPGDLSGAYLAAALNHAPVDSTGAGSVPLWTDLDACNHAIVSSRSLGDPIFLVADNPGALTHAQVWNVPEHLTCLDFLGQVLRRERARGMSLVTWPNDSGNPTGQFPTLTINVYPQFYQDVVYSDPITGGAVTIAGALTCGSGISGLDLQGDHRHIAETFRIGSRYANKYDYVETVGEPIEVAVTLSYSDGTLSPGWTAAQQSAFIAATAAQRVYDTQTYELHCLLSTWYGKVGNGNAGGLHFFDKQCSDTGQIIDSSSNGAWFTSGLMTELMRDVPSNQPSLSGYGTVRDDPQVYVKVGSDKYINLRSEIGGSLQVRPDGFLVKHADDEPLGLRYFSNTVTASLGALFNYTDLTITCGLRLPHRVRMATGNPNASRRHPPIYHKGLHLWLGDTGKCIFALDYTSGDSVAGHSPDRTGSTFVGRDDRSELGFLHNLAWSWYGYERRTVSYQLRACGPLGTFLTTTGVGIYALIGNVIHQVLAGGQVLTIDTPVTRVHYDNRNCVTTWETDWSDLDLS